MFAQEMLLSGKMRFPHTHTWTIEVVGKFMPSCSDFVMVLHLSDRVMNLGRGLTFRLVYSRSVTWHPAHTNSLPNLLCSSKYIFPIYLGFLRYQRRLEVLKYYLPTTLATLIREYVVSWRLVVNIEVPLIEVYLLQFGMWIAPFVYVLPLWFTDWNCVKKKCAQWMSDRNYPYEILAPSSILRNVRQRLEQPTLHDTTMCLCMTTN